MRVFCFLAWMTLAACTAAPLAHAQVPAPRGPLTATIAAIHATGSHYTEAQIVTASGLKPGEAVTREQIQEAADRLARLGVFSNVNYNFSSDKDRITVTFVLADAARVPVEFDDFPWFTDKEIEAAIRELAPLYDGTAPPDGAELQAIDAALARLLTTRGLPGEVEHRLIAQPVGEGMEMQFHVNRADVILDSLEFSDETLALSPQLRDRLRDIVKHPYSRFALNIFENEQIRPLYLASGHVRVRFGEPEVRLAGSTGAGRLSVKLHIEPGPVFHFAGVEWRGNSAVTAAELANAVGLKAGDLADGMKLNGAWQHVQSEYMRRGYLDAKVTPQPQFDDAAGTVTYHITVQEGPQYHMGELVLTGLSLGAENRLKAAWKLTKGAVFDRTYYDSMMEKLNKPSEEIFKDLPVHYSELGQWLRTDAKTAVADVLLDFK